MLFVHLTFNLHSTIVESQQFLLQRFPLSNLLIDLILDQLIELYTILKAVHVVVTNYNLLWLPKLLEVRVGVVFDDSLALACKEYCRRIRREGDDAWS